MSNSDSILSRFRRAPVRHSLVAAGLVAGGMVMGAGGLAVAAAGGDMGGGMGWHGHHHHGPRTGMIQRRVRGALDNVGATTAQEDKVHDIIAGAATELGKDEGDRGAMRKQVLELMKAPTLDRAAFEKLRAQKIADMDAKSKVISGALFDAASQLSPEQRAKLVANVEQHMEHGGPGGRHEGGRHDGGRMNGPDGGRGPDDRGGRGSDRG